MIGGRARNVMVVVGAERGGQRDERGRECRRESHVGRRRDCELANGGAARSTNTSNARRCCF